MPGGRGVRPLRSEVAELLAIQAGVCVRPIPFRVRDAATGESRVVSLPCGARLESQCPPCAKRNRQLRMVQCREGWHLEQEPESRAREGHRDGGGDAAVRAAAASIHSKIETAGEGGGEEEGGARRVRSTRRRQDAPRLPKRARRAGTVGRAVMGPDGVMVRPSMFITLTLPSYGRVRSGGVPVDPDRYDYVRAVRDAVHLPMLVNRFVRNLRRVAGWSVQYFAAVEFQKRLAPHVHMAVRGTLPVDEVRQVAAATYVQVWWPPVDRVAFEGRRPVWHESAGCYVDLETGEVLTSWNAALDRLGSDPSAVPLHVARFGAQVDVVNVLAGTEETEACIRYLAKYLTKSVAAGAVSGGGEGWARRRHVRRLLEVARWEPCSPGCANWLRYGIEPEGAGAGLVPGWCRGRAHRAEGLGYGGRRVLVSRRWSGKTLGEHRRESRAWALAALGVREEERPEPGGLVWERAREGDVDVAPRAARVLDLVAERQRWRVALMEAGEAREAAEAGETVEVGMPGKGRGRKVRVTLGDPLPGMDDESLGCGSAEKRSGEGRMEEGRAEGSESGVSATAVQCVRSSATTDPRAGGRAEEGGGQGAPPVDDLGQGDRGGPVARRRRSPRARSAGQGGDGEGVSAGEGLSPEDREWVRRTAAAIGPLPEEVRDYLAMVFKNPHRS
ncbi:replication initiator [Thermocatellispora tengchongensis]|nr:replication initiator [Thermocatellispora tengchongensis]